MTSTLKCASGSRSLFQPDLFPQVKSTAVPSRKSPLVTLRDLCSITSFAASLDGPLLSNEQDGQQIAPSGPEVVPVNPSAPPVSGKAKRTHGMSGPSSTDSSGNAAPLSSWESRLRARMGSNGSMEYRLIWKHRTTPSGRQIYALRASGRRTSDSASTGWPTPNAMPEGRGGLQTNPEKALQRREQGHQLNLDDAACLALPMAGWPTCAARDHKSGESIKDLTNARPLSEVCLLAGWSSPTAMDGSRGILPPRSTDTGHPLDQQAAMSGWNTPRESDGSHGGPNQKGGALSADAALAGWGTPRVTTNGGVGSLEWASDGQARLEDQVHGVITTSSTAETEKRGALNPALSRWLQDYPPEWCQAAIRAFRKFKQLPRRAKCASRGTETP